MLRLQQQVTIFKVILSCFASCMFLNLIFVSCLVPIKRRRSLLASDKDHFSEGAIAEKNNVLITRDTISASNTLSQNQSANVVSGKDPKLHNI